MSAQSPDKSPKVACAQPTQEPWVGSSEKAILGG